MQTKTIKTVKLTIFFISYTKNLIGTLLADLFNCDTLCREYIPKLFEKHY